MNVRRLATAATIAFVALSSSTASAQDEAGLGGRPAERMERETIRPNRPLLITGGAVIAASYIPPVVVAATSDRRGDQNLYIPVAGPWIDLAERGGCGPNPCSEEAVYKGLLVTAGTAHLVGVGLVISSFLVPEERTVQTSSRPMIVPGQVGGTGTGLNLVGTF